MNNEAARRPARQGNKNILLVLFFVLLVSIDQLSKYLIRSQGGFYICNKGIAFGINLLPVVFWAFWLIIVSVLVLKIFNFQFSIFNQFTIPKFSNKNPLIHNSLFLILIIAGATSNLIDRLRFGCVIDFIDIRIWPVFNLADSFIVLGVIMIILSKFNFFPKARLF